MRPLWCALWPGELTMGTDGSIPARDLVLMLACFAEHLSRKAPAKDLCNWTGGRTARLAALVENHWVEKQSLKQRRLGHNCSMPAHRAAPFWRPYKPYSTFPRGRANATRLADRDKNILLQTRGGEHLHLPPSALEKLCGNKSRAEHYYTGGRISPPSFNCLSHPGPGPESDCWSIPRLSFLLGNFFWDPEL